MTADIASILLHAAEKGGGLLLRSIVLLDWHDGPVEGIAEIVNPVSFWHFRMLGERTSSDDLDDRIYLLAQVAEPAMERIKASAAPVGEKPLVWPFDERANSAELRTAVDDAISSAAAPTLLIQSATFRDIKGIWRFSGGRFSHDNNSDRSK
jgi:hypothetical protein